jgi:hypothetical protein
MSKQFQLVAVAFLLVGCAKTSTTAPPPVPNSEDPVMKLPEAYADKGGLVSLTFDIASFIDPKKYGGATKMTIEARHKYTAMRFDIVVSQFEASFNNTGMGDQFYQVLDELFGVKEKHRGMRALTKFNVETLEGDASDLDKGPAKLKLIHANGAQFLLIVDMKAKKVELREIDKKYRKLIIDALEV